MINSDNGSKENNESDFLIHEHRASIARDYPAKGGVIARTPDGTPFQSWAQESQNGEERAWILIRADERIGYPHVKTGPAWDLLHFTPCRLDDQGYGEGFVMTAISGCKIRRRMPDITVDELGEVVGRDAARVLLEPFSRLGIKESGTT